MCISLMSSLPGAEHLKVAVLITTSSSNFLITSMGKINIFHIEFLLTHIAKIFFATGDYFITKLLWEALPTDIVQFVLWEQPDLMLRLGGFVEAKQLSNVEFNKDLESYQYTTAFLLRHENIIKEFFCLTSVNTCMHLLTIPLYLKKTWKMTTWSSHKCSVKHWNLYHFRGVRK